MKVVKYPNPLLNKVSKEIENIDKDIKILAEKMFETMYENNGVGLAGPQVGISKRIFVINIHPKDENKDKAKNEIVFINPVLSNFAGEQEEVEGCLSVPGINKLVKRAKSVTVTATNLAGEEFTLNVEGFFAQAVQHEYDHLEGILFIQRLSESEQIGIKSVLNSLKQKYQKEKEKKEKKLEKQKHKQKPPRIKK